MTVEEFGSAYPDESDYAEFKSGIGTKPIQEAAVAFSNADGGVILIGVSNDGTVLGHALDESTRLSLHESCGVTHNIGAYEIDEVKVGDVALTLLRVQRARGGVAQTSNGRALRRRGKSNPPLLGTELSRHVMSRGNEDYETAFAVAPLAAAVPEQVDALASAMGWSAHAPELLASSPYTTELEDELTLLGTLVLTERPSTHLGKSKVELYRYPDDGLLSDKRHTIEGPINEQITQSRDWILSELGHDTGFVGSRRVELEKIPRRVLREAMANALGHRDYQLWGTAVRVDVRPSRVVITSPGGLVPPVSLANLRNSQAARNPELMRTLRAFGLAEDSGDGVDLMIDGMVGELLDPPEFEATDVRVQVTLKLGSVVTPTERAQITQLETSGSIQAADRRLLVPLLRGNHLDNRTVRELLGVDSTGARQALQRLRDAELVEKHGRKSATRYLPAADVRRRLSLAGRAEAADRVVLQLAQETTGGIQNSDVRRTTGLDRAEALSLLQELVARGELVRTGAKRGTRYFPSTIG